MSRRYLSISLGAVLIVLAGCSQGSSVVTTIPRDQTPTPRPSEAAASEAPSAAPSQASAEQPITITGSGISKSAPFHLNGGTYKVDWTATPSSSAGCYHSASLGVVDPNQRMFEVLADELLDSATPKTGSTLLHNLAAGDYYVDANSGCDWSFTFTPQ